ncbi:MAG: GatB/YqeY domain-containing protein [Deferribacteraceae bacterium]|nr:GatB/YqeY domain-containing protein [Deferribacteraceae bacterium]
MALKDVIAEDMKLFMKAKDTYALEAIRMLRSEIKNTEIDMKTELDDAGVLKVVQSAQKKHKEALEEFTNAGRTDLMAKSQTYVDTLSKYLPTQLSDSELDAAVREAIAELGELDPKSGFGQAMKAAIAKVGSRADGKLISAKVKEILG